VAEAKISVDIASTSTTILSAKFMAETRIIRHTSLLLGWAFWWRNYKIISSATFAGAQPELPFISRWKLR
jgi:hypothetical protein